MDLSGGLRAGIPFCSLLCVFWSQNSKEAMFDRSRYMGFGL